MDITSRQNPLIKEFRELLKDKKKRQNEGRFVIEGGKLVHEAIKTQLEIEGKALVTKQALEKYSDIIKEISQKCEIIIITEDLSEYISDTKAPQGIFITAKTLDKYLNIDTIYKSKRYIILEKIQDMGNIGAIIRTCDAFSFDGVIMSSDCGDIYSPKIIRSTMGSVFRLPVYIYDDLAQAVSLLKSGEFTIHCAMLDKRAEKLNEISFEGKHAVVIGNEGNGISDYLFSLCDQTLYIPMNNAESLNASVAAGIICWEMAKK